MKKILRIDSSVRLEGSHSRRFADEVEERLLATYQGSFVTKRDLSKSNIPHLVNDTIVGYFTPKDEFDDNLKKATQTSDKLIQELKEADIILLSAPMYNFSIPSVLKAYIDQITRVNETFLMDENGFTGLLKDKEVFIVLSYGAVFTNTDFSAMDFVEPYLKGLFNFLGVEKIEFLKLEGSNMDESIFKRTINESKAKLEQLF